MPIFLDSRVLPLIIKAQRLVAGSQLQLGTMLGLSRRTITRWYGRKSMPTVAHIEKIAAAVYPQDRDLAAQLAAHIGQTVVSLGLEAPVVDKPAPPPPASPPGPPPRPIPSVSLLVESIVCAAAEALEATPATVRPVLRAAFARAHALALTVEEVDGALTMKAEPSQGAGPGAGAGAGAGASKARAKGGKEG